MINKGDSVHIYVSGSIAYDRIMDFPGKFSDYILPDKIHILNVCFIVNGMSEKFGGTAGNDTLKLEDRYGFFNDLVFADAIPYLLVAGPLSHRFS